jgi:hypothetical protein
VALAQAEKSTWTCADLVKYLGRVLPWSGRDPAQAAALLEDLADRALGSEFEPVLCLEVPELTAGPGISAASVDAQIRQARHQRRRPAPAPRGIRRARDGSLLLCEDRSLSRRAG